MGTRADFYIKKAEQPELVWLGSIAWDGYPDGIEEPNVLEAKTEGEYLKLLTEFFSKRKDLTLPERGWPWPWDNSKTTDYAYCFHDGTVSANCFGHGWYDPSDESDEPVITWGHPYPDMKSRKNVRMDEGSGLIVIRA